MDALAFAKAVAVLAVAVAGTFALLLALPLSTGFFREWGLVIGPLAWVLCSALTGCVLRLSARRGVAATALSGVVAAATGLVLDHSAGIVGGLAVYGVVAATSVRRRPRLGVSA